MAIEAYNFHQFLGATFLAAASACLRLLRRKTVALRSSSEDVHINRTIPRSIPARVQQRQQYNMARSSM